MSINLAQSTFHIPSGLTSGNWGARDRQYVTLTLGIGRGFVPFLSAKVVGGEVRWTCRGWGAFAAFNRVAAGLAEAQRKAA